VLGWLKLRKLNCVVSVGIFSVRSLVPFVSFKESCEGGENENDGDLWLVFISGGTLVGAGVDVNVVGIVGVIFSSLGVSLSKEEETEELEGRGCKKDCGICKSVRVLELAETTMWLSITKAGGRSRVRSKNGL